MFRALLFIFFLLPLSVGATVRINEIAWMGTVTSYNDEWIELYNDGSEAIILDGWQLVAADGSPNILLGGTIAAGGFFLLERPDDDSVPGIVADLLYTGALGNSGEHLALKDQSGAIIDELDQTSGWSGGNNTTKETMQWNGVSWMTGTPSPRAQNQGVTGGGGENEEEISPPEEEVGTETGATVGQPATFSAVPPIKTITVKIKKETKTVIVGAGASFLGEAYGFEGEAIANARYMWNFGDGTTKEGKHVSHIFRYPGTYVVVLDAASGEYSAGDRLVVEAESIALSITQTEESGELFVKIKNNSSHELDLSGWLLKHGGLYFRIPEHSFLLSKKEIIFPGSVTGFLNDTHTELLYPNGKTAVLQVQPPTTQIAEVPKVLPMKVVPPRPSVAEKKLSPAPKEEAERVVEKHQALARVGSAPGVGSGPLAIFFLLLLVGGSSIGFLVMRRKGNLADEFSIINDVEREK
ncbi:MAG: lamin tail domain-containing protein [Parcubacteria group bacterium]|nr:lamin tail domain-containing protein [Parcubacteria group bacterium]